MVFLMLEWGHTKHDDPNKYLFPLNKALQVSLIHLRGWTYYTTLAQPPTSTPGGRGAFLARQDTLYFLYMLD